MNIFQIIHNAYIQKKHSGKAVIIGIDGLDCSGKTYFAQSLKKYFIDMKISSTVVDIDNFNIQTIERDTYRSFSEGIFTDSYLEKYYHQIIDFELAKKTIKELQNDYSIIIVEGIFIYKKKLVDIFDFKIYFTIDGSVVIKRFQLRQKRNKDVRPVEIFEKIWLPSYIQYINEINPKDIADLVINNTDYNHPTVIKHH